MLTHDGGFSVPFAVFGDSPDADGFPNGGNAAKRAEKPSNLATPRRVVHVAGCCYRPLAPVAQHHVTGCRALLPNTPCLVAGQPFCGSAVTGSASSGALARTSPAVNTKTRADKAFREPRSGEFARTKPFGEVQNRDFSGTKPFGEVRNRDFSGTKPVDRHDPLCPRVRRPEPTPRGRCSRVSRPATTRLGGPPDVSVRQAAPTKLSPDVSGPRQTPRRPEVGLDCHPPEVRQSVLRDGEAASPSPCGDHPPGRTATRARRSGRSCCSRIWGASHWTFSTSKGCLRVTNLPIRVSIRKRARRGTTSGS